MRRWAALTAVLTIPLGMSFLVHEHPPTGGHALAGLAILGPSLLLLGGIAALGVQRTKGNAIWLLVFQLATTVAAMVALAMQQLPWTAARALVILILVIPVIGSVRHFRPATWTPKPLTDRDLITDLIVEVVLVVGAVGLMVGLHAYPIGLIGFVLSGIVAIWLTAWRLRLRRSLARLEEQGVAG